MVDSLQQQRHASVHSFSLPAHSFYIENALQLVTIILALRVRAMVPGVVVCYGGHAHCAHGDGPELLSNAELLAGIKCGGHHVVAEASREGALGELVT
jgi:hypothetical protein